jgi:hypothetical protein
MVKSLRIVLLVALSCIHCADVAKKGNVAEMSGNQIQKIQRMDWLRNTKITLFATLPWDGKDGFPKQMGTDISALIAPQDAMEAILPIALKIDPAGQCLIFGGTYTQLLSATGQAHTFLKLELPPAYTACIDLAQQDNGMLWGLWDGPDEKVSLLQWDAQGRLLGAFEFNVIAAAIPDFEAGDLVKIWCLQQQIYLACEGTHPSLYAFDRQAQKLRRIWTLQEDTGLIFPYKNGNVGHITYLPDSGKRAWTIVDPKSGATRLIAADDDLFGMLALPCGTDSLGRGYGASGYEMGCLDANGTTRFLIQLDHLAYDAAHKTLCASVYMPKTNVLEVAMLALGTLGPQEPTFLEIKIPATVLAQLPDALWRVVAVETSGDLLLQCRNPRDYALYQCRIDQAGVALGDVTKVTKTDPIADQLQPANTWGITPDGNLLLPVLGADALRIFQIEF